MENGLRAAYIHEQIEDKQVTVRYVPGREQRADLLTKSFPKQRLQELTSLWGFLNLVQEAARLSMMKVTVLCIWFRLPGPNQMRRSRWR